MNRRNSIYGSVFAIIPVAWVCAALSLPIGFLLWDVQHGRDLRLADFDSPIGLIAASSAFPQTWLFAFIGAGAGLLAHCGGKVSTLRSLALTAGITIGLGTYFWYSWAGIDL